MKLPAVSRKDGGYGRIFFNDNILTHAETIIMKIIYIKSR